MTSESACCRKLVSHQRLCCYFFIHEVVHRRLRCEFLILSDCNYFRRSPTLTFLDTTPSISHPDLLRYRSIDLTPWPSGIPLHRSHILTFWDTAPSISHPDLLGYRSIDLTPWPSGNPTFVLWQNSLTFPVFFFIFPWLLLNISYGFYSMFIFLCMAFIYYWVIALQFYMHWNTLFTIPRSKNIYFI